MSRQWHCNEEEVHQIAKMLVVFQKLPPIERIKMEYYIQGRADALTSNDEISTKTEIVKRTEQHEAAVV